MLAEDGLIVILAFYKTGSSMKQLAQQLGQKQAIF